MTRDYWPRFSRPSIIAITAGHILTTGILATTLWLFGLFESNLVASLIIIAAQFTVGGVLIIAIFTLLTKPLKHLLAAITHIANEPTATAPPSPNEKRFAKNGFREILQTLYSLAADRPSEDGTDATGNQQAANARRFIEQALDNTLCGFVTFNSQRAITYSNKATPVRIDANGITSLELLFHETNSLDTWWDECDKTSVHAEKTWARISNKLPNEEDRRFFDIIASYNKGAESEVVLMLVDRTHLYNIGEEELDFIAFAAHELRGPITVIRGYLDVLQDELSAVLQDDQKELFHRLSVSANRLSGYVNNILNTSRYDRRHLRVHLSETTYASIYDTISDDMALRARSQNRLISVNIPNDLPTIAADTASLSEVMSNLIDNAIKYSNEGGAIAVSAGLRGELVEFSVEDHGIGMPANVIGNLFQKFYRSHRSRETVAGTGIGLYISKAIVESHGGTVGVRSEEGVGSTFTISLPTYRSVAAKLESGDNNSVMQKTDSSVWINNHTAFRG